MTLGISGFLQYFLALVFFFFLYSQLVTWALEFWADRMNWRGRFLRGHLRNWLGRGRKLNWLERIMSHPMIHGLCQSDQRSTEWIPPSIFADAVIDVLVDESRDHKVIQLDDGSFKVLEPENQAEDVMAEVDRGINKIEASNFKDILVAARRRSSTADAFRKAVEQNFQAYMGRVNSWYKRRLRWPLFLFGLIVAVTLNVDSIKIAQYLWEDRQFTAAMAAEAERLSIAYDSADSIPREELDQRLREFIELTDGRMRLPFGWVLLFPENELDSGDNQAASGAAVEQGQSNATVKKASQPVGKAIWAWCMTVLGWIFSAIIAAIGAPFWFDVMRKVTGYRSRPAAS